MTVGFLTESSQPRPIGRIIDGRIDADNLWTTDREFLAVAETLDDIDEIGSLCQEVFDLGVSVRNFARTTSQMSNVEQQIDRFEERVESATGSAIAAIASEMERLAEPESGVLAGAVSREMQSLRAVVDAAFDENDKTSALSRIESAVQDANAEMVKAASASVKSLLDPSTPESPMANLRSSIVTDLRRDLDQLVGSVTQMREAMQIRDAVAQEAEKGTQKGFTFENIVAGVLSDAAASTGDAVVATGTEPGAIPNSKVGDFTATVAAPRGSKTRVAFECKDTKLSAKKIREELDRAVENREAEVGVMVFASEDLTPYGAPLVRFADRRYVVVLDKSHRDDLALKVAYQMARTDALAATIRSAEDGVNLRAVAERLGEARALLNEVTRVKQGIGKARAGLDQAESSVQGMRTDLEAILDQVSDEISGTN